MRVLYFSNANQTDSKKLYEKLVNKYNHRVIEKDQVFVGWNTRLIDEGKFSYAFSHTPIHQLDLPLNIFKFTCLRDPVNRVVSHYNMIKYYEKYDINNPCMLVEGKWLGNSFSDFITNLPHEHLMNQLYMFSKKFNIQEASERLLSLNAVLYTERLNEDLGKLESLTGWDLPVSNQKSYGFKEEINSNDLNILKERLTPEYDLIELIKKEQNKD